MEAEPPEDSDTTPTPLLRWLNGASFSLAVLLLLAGQALVSTPLHCEEGLYVAYEGVIFLYLGSAVSSSMGMLVRLSSFEIPLRLLVAGVALWLASQTYLTFLA